MTDQNTAPERIWAWATGVQPEGHSAGLWRSWDASYTSDASEYIPVDLHKRLVAEAVAAALEKAINRVGGCDRVSEVPRAIRALSPDDAKAALEAAKAEAYRAGMLRAAEIAKGEGESEFFNPVQAIRAEAEREK